jgi:hypothetical protein
MSVSGRAKGDLATPRTLSGGCDAMVANVTDATLLEMTNRNNYAFIDLL